MTSNPVSGASLLGKINHVTGASSRIGAASAITLGKAGT